MARQATVAFKRISRSNKFPTWRRAVGSALYGKGTIVHHTTRFAARKIKTIQRKAPKKPRHYSTDMNRSLYGSRATYNPKSKAFKSGKRTYVKKGLYSKPGSPPFWHKKSSNVFQTMRIVGSFDIKGYASAWKPVYRGRGHAADSKVVGPAIRKQKGISVPILHEQGGTVRLNRRKTFYRARNGAKIMRPKPGMARYAARPFVGVGGEMGAREAWKKYHIKKFTKIGGVKASKVQKFRKVA